MHRYKTQNTGGDRRSARKYIGIIIHHKSNRSQQGYTSAEKANLML